MQLLRSLVHVEEPSQQSEPLMDTQVTISKDDTIVLDGGGDKSAITERCDQIRESVEASTSDYDRCCLSSCVSRLQPQSST